MNGDLLKSIILLNGKTIKELSHELEISKSAMYRKMYGKSEFTRAEISQIIEILDIDFHKAMKIFFDDKVAQKTQKGYLSIKL